MREIQHTFMSIYAEEICMFKQNFPNWFGFRQKSFIFSLKRKKMLILQNEVLKRSKKAKVKIASEISYGFVCAHFVTF